jgi:hypothetical protein
MPELGEVILQDGIRQPPGLTVPAQDALVEAMQGLENAELQHLVVAHTLQAHNRTPARQDRGVHRRLQDQMWPRHRNAQRRGQVDRKRPEGVYCI